MLNISTTAHGDNFPMGQIILFFEALQDYSIVKLNPWSAYFFILKLMSPKYTFLHGLTVNSNASKTL